MPQSQAEEEAGVAAAGGAVAGVDPESAGKGMCRPGRGGPGMEFGGAVGRERRSTADTPVERRALGVAPGCKRGGWALDGAVAVGTTL